jgi:hypothetical protein
MILVARRKLFAGDQKLQNRPQLSQIFSSLFGSLDIAPKLSGPDRRQHLRRPNP